MTLHKAKWSHHDRARYDWHVLTAYTQHANQSDRIDAFLNRIRGDAARPAQWPYAAEVLAHLARLGASSLLSTEQKARSMVVVNNGGVKRTKTKMVGAIKRDPATGVEYPQQTLFDLMTWDELRRKMAEFEGQRDGAQFNYDTIRKLLKLEQMVPGAAGPADACAALGITIEDYLAS